MPPIFIHSFIIHSFILLIKPSIKVLALQWCLQISAERSLGQPLFCCRRAKIHLSDVTNCSAKTNHTLTTCGLKTSLPLPQGPSLPPTPHPKCRHWLRITHSPLFRKTTYPPTCNLFDMNLREIRSTRMIFFSVSYFFSYNASFGEGQHFLKGRVRSSPLPSHFSRFVPSRGAQSLISFLTSRRTRCLRCFLSCFQDLFPNIHHP